MKIRYLIALIILLGACASEIENRIPAVEEAIPVKVMMVERKIVHEPIFASGTFTSDDEAIRAFKTGGIVQKLFVREGDAIRKDQLLATLDLTEITAQVTQASLACEKAKRDYARVNNLYKDSVVTLEMFENAGTALELAEEQLTAARFNRTHSEIRATEDGFVLRKFVNEGQVVGPGTPVFQTNGAGDGEWILRVAVSDGQWSKLTVGDSAVITTDVINVRPITAKVTKKSEGVDPYSGTFTVDIKPCNHTGLSVASGMFGKAAVTPSKGRNLWKIPYDALLDGNGNQGFVFVTLDNQKARKLKVSIAGLNRDHVLIDGGLDSCNTIIVSGNAYLSDESPITIVKE
jgi:RND family efflux transporter MFP subunit